MKVPPITTNSRPASGAGDSSAANVCSETGSSASDSALMPTAPTTACAVVSSSGLTSRSSGRVITEPRQ